MVTGATGLVGVPGPIAVHGVSRRSNTGERVTARFGSADARRGGAAVMYGPDLIMKAGGRVTEYRLAIADVYTLNASAPTRIWQLRSPWPICARITIWWSCRTGQSSPSGGGRDKVPEDPFNPDFTPVLEPERYDPTTDTWQPMALMLVARYHHSAALLLSDARVLLAGGNDFTTAHIFSPPYFFFSDPPSTMDPVIEAAPDEVFYQSEFQVVSASAPYIIKVTLIRLGAATHSLDQDLRFMELSFRLDQNDPTTLWVDAPAAPDDAPPGYYMLFILDSYGRPSVAKILKLAKKRVFIDFE